MSFVLRAVLILSLATLPLPSAFAAGDSEPTVDALVGRLADADFKARDAAAKALLARGEPAREALEAAASNSADPEVAARLRGILAQLDEIAKRNGLALELKAEKTTFNLGEAVSLTPTLHNRGKDPITLLRPIDGSDAGWRVVSYRWTVTNEQGEPVSERKIIRCKTSNPLKMANRLTLKPGDAFRPTADSESFVEGLSSYYELKPGTYRVTYTYAFDPSRPDRSNQKAGPDEAGVLEGVMPVAITSEPVTITVVAPGGAAPR